MLGRYNPDIDYERLSDEQLDAEHKETIRNGPVEAYVHGNAAAMLYKAIKASENGSVKVCITSTAGMSNGVIYCGKKSERRRTVANNEAFYQWTVSSCF